MSAIFVFMRPRYALGSSDNPVHWLARRSRNGRPWRPLGRRSNAARREMISAALGVCQLTRKAGPGRLDQRVLVGENLPQPHSAVIAGAEHPRPIWAERSGPDPALVAAEDQRLAGAVGTPQAHRAVIAGADHPGPVRTERRGPHLTLVAPED